MMGMKERIKAIILRSVSGAEPDEVEKIAEEILNSLQVVVATSTEGVIFTKDGELYIAYPYCSCWSGSWWQAYSKVSDPSLPHSTKQFISEALK